jgi:signal transduction histidine kinase
MSRASIRFRITTIAVGAVILMLGGVSVALVIAQRSQLTAALDATLRQRADDMATLLAPPRATPPRLGASQLEGFVQLVGEDGVVIASSPNLDGYQPLRSAYTIGSPERLATVTGLPIDDDSFRMLSRTIEYEGRPAVLHIGTTYDEVGESAEALTLSLAIAVPLVVLVLGLLVWWLVGRTLDPVEDIRAEVASIGPGDLNRRVPEPGTGDEIALLAGTMNSMLERIEAAVTRQQEFVADASHELRSPLTRMEIEADMAQNVAPGRQRLDSLRDEVIELQQLVEDLLHLARLGADRGDLATAPLDLDDLILEEGRLIQAAGRVVVDMSEVSGAHVVGDKRQLVRAIHNIVDNAARYAESRIELSLRESDGFAELVVADDGPGVPPAEVERIFERFTRMDDSRTRAGGGSGLGLAIARGVARRHGGDLRVEPQHPSQARFVMRIPLGRGADCA